MFSILINTRCYYVGWSISCWKRTFQLHNFLWLNIRTNSQFNSKLPNKWNYNFSTLCLRFKVRLHNSTRFLWNPSTEDWSDEKYKIILLVDFNAKVRQTFRLLKKQVVGQHRKNKLQRVESPTVLCTKYSCHYKHPRQMQSQVQ